jgi:hypothetical protein
MLIQDDGRGRRHSTPRPGLEGFQAWQEVWSTRVEFDGMRSPIQRNDASSEGWCVLETSQHIAGKGQRQLLLGADTIRPHTQRGCIPGCARHR